MQIRSILFLILPVVVALLAVPTAAQNTVPPGNTYAAFQQYERGMMIWREDTGAVYVLADASKILTVVPQSAYENLPDNADLDAPAGRVAPVRGFGRVWANVDGVRQSLGWALTEEVGYDAQFRRAGYSAGGLPQTRVNWPDGRLIVLRGDGSWGPYGLPRDINTLPAATTFSASWQAYEGGYLLWWSETGSVWVLEDNGSAQVINSQAYGTLAPNPLQAPEGFITPIMGFGRVWYHYRDIREALGWATAEEDAYQMQFTRQVTLSSVGGSTVRFIVTTPDGRRISITDVGTWSFVE